ncbi:MAG TPA: LssY C-terminal domain-containing protein [Candidatus Corynebacterium gallistercoris]|uniref:LssY C-terminal domain-containing protein n=1 Tax=Candidatus Corynebacterium gallistercoris TaxID=2838530 RepID=A0A9D1RXM6_9CORY|nr:LssY C-terminal domain-containing protein [Candidatus Corynebacterium gallistercoris]
MLLSFAFALSLVIRAGLSLAAVGYGVLFWGIMAYLALPRFHRTMTSIYVPDYFIGRSRTQEGLLGDPVNLAYNGTQEQVHAAMTAAGWTLADPITAKSSVTIVTSTLRRKSYPEAPVSPLLIFGKTQTLAYQQHVEGNPAQRHHIRLWKCPDDWLLPGGSRVDWVAAGTYDRAVGFSVFTFQITHKIDENVDIERDHVVDTVVKAVPEAQVSVIENFSTGYHSRNGGGDAIYTDGNLPVVDTTEVNPADYAEAAKRTTAVLPGEDHELERTRPISITGAAVFVVITALAAILSPLVELGELRREFVGDGLTSQETTISMGVYVGLIAVLNVLLIWLAWKMYHGTGWARLVLLGVVTITQFAQIIGVITGAHHSVGTVLSTSTGLLALYALTSLSAREWTTRADVVHGREQA